MREKWHLTIVLLTFLACASNVPTTLALVTQLNVYYQSLTTYSLDDFCASDFSQLTPTFLAIDFSTDAPNNQCTNGTVVACEAEDAFSGFAITTTCIQAWAMNPTPNCLKWYGICFVIESEWGVFVTLINSAWAFAFSTGAAPFNLREIEAWLPYGLAYFENSEYYSAASSGGYSGGGQNGPYTVSAPTKPFVFNADCVDGTPYLMLCADFWNDCVNYTQPFTSWADSATIPYQPFAPFINGTFLMGCQQDITKPAEILVTAAMDRLTVVDTGSSSFAGRYLIGLDWDVQDLILSGLYSVDSATNALPAIYWSSVNQPLSSGGGVTVLQQGTYYGDSGKRGFAIVELDAVYSQNFPLQAYPYDSHVLQLVFSHGTVAATTSSRYVVLVVGFYVPEGFTVSNIDQCSNCFGAAFNWSIGTIPANPPAGFDVDASSLRNYSQVSSSGASQAVFEFTIVRNPASTTQQIATIVIIFCVGLSMFALNPSDSNRANGTLTAFLTIVAYNFVVVSSLPPTSYLTRMSRFISLNNTMLAVLVAYHILISKVVVNVESRAETKRPDVVTTQLPELYPAAANADSVSESIELNTMAANKSSLTMNVEYTSDTTGKRKPRTCTRSCSSSLRLRVFDIGVLVIAAAMYTFLATYFLVSPTLD